ncbi:hypothetical protein BKA70DRAFT_1199047 [Coprinopsis sp. MPI-PUGE-AT-0042]|nr:hypothetical protein BKA70DRAFT_1199047 [Coprinopsis sp. MPI-PUGE-AT-0042]
MHLTGLNVTSVIMDIFRGTMDCGPGDNKAEWDWATLTGDFWEQHGVEVGDFRQYLPSSFDRPPRNIAKKINSGYKAREFLSYVYGYLPSMIQGVVSVEYSSHFCKLVRGIRLLLQHSISQSHLAEADKLLTEFCVEYEVLYVQRKPSRLHFVCQCIHNVLHLAAETLRCGPLCLIAQWTIERVIGYLGMEVHQHSNAYKNLSEKGLRRAQLNAVMAMAGITPPEFVLPRGAQDLGGGYVLLRPEAEKAECMGIHEKAAYSTFREAHYGLPPLPSTSNVHVFYWARLRLPTRQVARTSWKELSLKSDAPLRTSRMVKVRILIHINDNGKTVIGEVRYFFKVTLRASQETTLVMVNVMEDPRQDILEATHNVCWITQPSGQVRVYEATAIQSVVALLPFRQMPHHWFLFEDFGLEVAGTISEFALDDYSDSQDGT